MFVWMSAVLLFIRTLDDSSPPSDMRESCRFEGTWCLLQTRDERKTEVGSDGIRIAVARDGSVVFTFENLMTNRGTFKLSSCGKATRIDLTLADGQTFEGRFALQGDTLRMCFCEPGKGRPFSLDPRGTQWAEVWKRLPR